MAGLLPDIIPGADGPWGPLKPQEDNLQGNRQGSQYYFLLPADLLPEAFQVPFGLRKHVWTHGRQSGAQKIGFAARQKGFQAHSAPPTMRLACVHSPESESICDVIGLLALLPASHWDDNMRKSEDSASGLAHIGTHCMLVLAP